jgi:hypothetical protein
MFGVCEQCYQKFLSDQELQREAEFKTKTYLHCESDCSITLKMPLAQLTLSEPATRYSIRMEVMLPKLPTKGQFMSLLTVTPPPKGRTELKATLYVTSQGQLVNVAPKPSAALAGNNSVEGPPGSSTSAEEGAAEEGAAAEGDDTFGPKLAVMADWGTPGCNNFNRLAATRNVASGMEGGVLFTANIWHSVCLVADANDESLTVYLNGEQAFNATVPSNELLLSPKLRLFTGGLAAHSRGGDVRRVTLYNKALSPAEVRVASTQADINLLADAAPPYETLDAADIAPKGYKVYQSS